MFQLLQEIKRGIHHIFHSGCTMSFIDCTFQDAMVVSCDCAALPPPSRYRKNTAQVPDEESSKRADDYRRIYSQEIARTESSGSSCSSLSLLVDDWREVFNFSASFKSESDLSIDIDMEMRSEG